MNNFNNLSNPANPLSSLNPSNPSSPLNPLNPLNPASPVSPANPLNRSTQTDSDSWLDQEVSWFELLLWIVIFCGFVALIWGVMDFL